MMTSYNQPKNRPYHEPMSPLAIMSPLAQKPPSKLKKYFFYSKLHEATSHYRVWTAL